VEGEGVAKGLLKRVRAEKRLEKEVEQALGKRDPGWTEEQGLRLFKGMVHVPPKPELRREVLKEHHVTKISGHQGIDKTYKLVTRNYWWPTTRADCRQYVLSCEDCCQNGEFYASLLCPR
jgi:hypothetical protein